MPVVGIDLSRADDDRRVVVNLASLDGLITHATASAQGRRCGNERKCERVARVAAHATVLLTLRASGCCADSPPPPRAPVPSAPAARTSRSVRGVLSSSHTSRPRGPGRSGPRPPRCLRRQASVRRRCRAVSSRHLHDERGRVRRFIAPSFELRGPRRRVQFPRMVRGFGCGFCGGGFSARSPLCRRRSARGRIRPPSLGTHGPG